MRFKTIAKDDMSGFKEYERHVVKDKKEWKDLWDIVQQCFIPPKPLPEIDFEKYMIIGIALGECCSDGYSVSIDKIVDKKDRIEVYARSRGPSPEDIVGMMITHPYHIVRVKRLDKEVVFR